MNINTKKNLTALLSLVAIIACIFCFCACAPEKQPDTTPVTNKSIVIVVGEKTLAVTTDKTSVGQVLDQLQSELKLTFTYSGKVGGEFGRMLLSIDDITPSADASKREFVNFLASTTDQKYVFVGAPVIINGKEFYSTNYGVDSMDVIDGVTYAFMLATY
ncbi:MAG: hypothetical protein RR416_01790 [Clostridia bacterium]